MRRRAQTRAALLDAARRVFAARGYEDATIAEIAAAADIAVATVYLHFRDKDDLFTTLAEEGLVELRARVRRAIAPLPVERWVAATIRAVFRMAHEEREFVVLALVGLRRSGVGVQARATLTDQLTAVLDAAQEAGLLPEEDLSLLSRQLTGLIVQSTLWWFEHPEVAPDAMANRVLRLLRDGLPSRLMLDDDAEVR